MNRGEERPLSNVTPASRYCLLLVPPTGAPGSNVVFLCLLSVFFFLALILCDCHNVYLFSWTRSISVVEGVVWGGWTTSLLRLFRTVWRRGAGHSWWTPDGDGRQGSKVPGGLGGRTWLCYSHNFIFLCLVICPSLFTSSGVFSSFLFSSFLLLFRSVFFVFVVALFPFVSLLRRMCMSCLSCLVWWHGIALPTACAYCIPGTWYVATY